MKRKSIKLFAVVLCLCIFAAALVGCSDGPAEGAQGSSQASVADSGEFVTVLLSENELADGTKVDTHQTDETSAMVIVYLQEKNGIQGNMGHILDLITETQEAHTGTMDFVALYFHLGAGTFPEIANIYMFDDGEGLYLYDQGGDTGPLVFSDEEYEAYFLGLLSEEGDADEEEFEKIELANETLEDGTQAITLLMDEAAIGIFVYLQESNGVEHNYQYIRKYMRKALEEYSGTMDFASLAFYSVGDDGTTSDVALVFMADDGSGILLQYGGDSETNHVSYFDDEYKQQHLAGK